MSGPTSEAVFFYGCEVSNKSNGQCPQKAVARYFGQLWLFLRSAIAKPTRFTFHARTAINRTVGRKPGVGVSVGPPGGGGASRCMDSAVACHFGDNWSPLREQHLSARELSELLLSEEECGRTRLRRSLRTHPHCLHLTLTPSEEDPPM